jgi:ribosomal protein S18 acetylase RimI-like enzyme
MSEKDGFDFLALYDGMLFVGFMAVMTYKSMAYLFFLAIDKARRSHGYGSQALKLLKDTYPNYQQTVDMEMLEAKAPNNLQRQKRRAFYLRNGYQATGKFLSYLGVNYEILCKDQHFDFNLYKEMMTQVKVKGFYPKYFDEKTIKNQ